MKKIAIIGSSGQLGTDLSRELGQRDAYELHTLDHSDIECADRRSIESAILSIAPDIVLNCAAFVRVNESEDDPDSAFRVNALGAGYVARACSEIGAITVYISTDYVFDGASSTPYSEEDPPNPLNVYAISKLAGEFLVRNFCKNHFIVRSSGLYGTGGTGGNQKRPANFVETILSLAKNEDPIRVVDDQILTPTFTKDLARAILELVDTDAYGTYHITNSGACSWYEFGKAVFEISGLKPDYGPVSSKEYGAKALRPSYSVLDNGRVQRLGIAPLRGWRDALTRYLELRSRA